MDTFLSVDLDYWTQESDDKEAIVFFEELQKEKKPTFLVQSHEEMLPAINASGCLRLVNMDAHSDLAERRHFGPPNASYNRPGAFREVDLRDGTWVSCVKWRRRGEYLWVTRDGISCELYHDPFSNTHGKITDWRWIGEVDDYFTIPWKDVKLVGIAWSPDYTPAHTVLSVLPFLGLENCVAEEWERGDNGSGWDDESVSTGIAPRWVQGRLNGVKLTEPKPVVSIGG